MFKVARVNPDSFKIARDICQKVYEEDKSLWPYGLDPQGFDDGLYLIREKNANTPIGFCGFQKRYELERNVPTSVGYYSIGILPEYRHNGFAKEAVAKLISMKSGGVDRVRALIMAKNEPSKALAKSLGVEIKIKRASTHPSWQSFIPAGVLATGTGGLYKIRKDMANARGRMGSWVDAMGKYTPQLSPKAIGSNPVSPEIGSQILDDYVTHGRNVAQARVAGIPSGKFLEFAARFRQDPNDRAGALKHYNIFTNPESTLADLRGHMWEKALHAHKGGEAFRNPAIFSDEVKAYMEGNKNLSTSMMSKALHFKFPESGKVFADAVFGVPGSLNVSDIGDARRLAGNGATILSTPEVYARNLSPILDRIESVSKPALAIGAAATAGLAAYPFLRKHASQQDAHPRTELATASGMAALAPFLALPSYQSVANPNRRIGFTYGEMTSPYGVADVGNGHKAPAQAIKQIVQQAIDKDTRYQQFSLADVPRNRAGLVRSVGDKFNTLVDTGLGAYSYDWTEGERRTHGHGAPSNLSFSTHMPLLTDAVADDRNRLGATMKGGPFQRQVFMGYGPGFTEAARRNGYKNTVQLSEGLTPALSQDALSILEKPTDRGSVFSELVKHYAGQPEHAGLSQRLAEVAKDIGNKRLVTISGSGRGDYVATRASELAAALKANNIHDVVIAAQMADAYNDPVQRKLLDAHPEVIALPKMKQAPFINLQRNADVHWGSSGTSSLAESLLHGNPLALPRDWGYREKWFPSGTSRKITPGSLAEKLMQQVSGSGVDPYHGQVATTTWNRGNLQYAHSRPGVLAADSAADMLKILSDPKTLQQSKEFATQRGAEELSRFTAGKANLSRAILDEAERNVFKSRLLGGAGLLGSAGLLTGAGYLGNRALRSASPAGVQERLRNLFHR